MNRTKPVYIDKFFLIFIGITTFVFSVLSTPAQISQAGETTRILIVPFTINAAEKFSYLQQGISDMLTSRLEKDSNVTVATADGKRDNLKALSQTAAADYVITGSVTIVGDSASTDAQVLKGSAVDTPVLSFNRTGRQQAELIEHINELAATINTRLLGHSPSQPDQSVPPTIGKKTSPSVVTAPMPSPATDRHPSNVGKTLSQTEPTRLPGIGSIKGQASGISAGDVDGDGIADIVTITSNHLFVYRFIGAKWAKLAEYDSVGDFIGVDIADVNGNGRQEIFVTRFGQKDSKVLSFVLEWDGNDLQRIATQLPWYFRNVDFFHRGRILVGQRQGQGKQFTSGIYEMQWTNTAYTAGERLALPRNLNIFGFACGAVRSPDKPEVVTYDSDSYVQILSPSGEEIWLTTEKYGGGANFIVFTDEEQWDEKEYIYLPPRIHLHDVDNDGVQELLVVKNQFSFKGSSVLARHRIYAKGRLEWLKYQNAGIRSTSHTMDVARFIADSALVDVDGDGDLDVVAAVVKKTRGITTKGSSYLVGFAISSIK
ncbi:uncharacterized protein Dvar_41160 [Desulfosarcina variabilis str. Montpellier]|uniref:FG-GAP-like repeat-containing protein n=1 Tax=Desulfosarcina variabilis TaxID=2300 RepID=UPI003AFAA1B2